MSGNKIKKIFHEYKAEQFFKELVPFIDIYKVPVVLDTRLQSTTTPYSWKIATEADQVNQDIGFVIPHTEIKNIFAMRMTGFSFKGSTEYGTLFQKPTDDSYLLERKLNAVVSISIKELQNQSIIHHTGLRSHFLFDVVAPPSYDEFVASSERFNGGYFEFREPIKYLNSITLDFGLNFYPDEWIQGDFDTDPQIFYLEFICLKD